MESIPCITIHQPWASLIALGYKTIETRTHARFAGLVGKRIGIHAGKRFDKRAAAAIADALGCTTADLVHTLSDPDSWPSGCLICTVHASAYTVEADENVRRNRKALCDTTGLHCLHLDGARVAFAGHAVIPTKGAQGIWYFTARPEHLPMEFARHANRILTIGEHWRLLLTRKDQ